MKNIVRLSGEKVDLCVRRIDDEAIEAYTRWMNDESINLWLGKNNKVKQRVEEEKWAREPVKAGHCSFNIVEKSTDKLIGNCDIRQQGTSRNYGLGICIGEADGRDKGYGTETIKMLVKFGFEQCGAHRVFLRLISDNTRALACYKKCGFKEVGRNREAEWMNSHWVDEICMDILEQEYFKAK